MNLFPIRIHLGGLYTVTGKFDEALKIYKEYIHEKDKPGGEFFIFDVFTGLVKLYLKRNEYIQATKLYGFIEFLSKDGKRKNINKGLNISDHEKNKLLEELGEEKFNLHFEEGKAMKLDEAVSYCLSNEQSMVSSQ